MENNSNKPQETLAFGITMVIFAILFFIFLKQLPFPDDYGFINYVGVFVGCCFIVGLIYGGAVGLVNAIYKVIIEVIVAILILFNAIYVAICWVSIDEIVINMNFELDQKFIAIAILALALFIFDVLMVILLLPFARIANSSVLD